LLRISVTLVGSVPPGTNDLPVLYVVDADLMFPLATEIARFRCAGGVGEPLMVVGIGYGSADFGDFARRRTADLTLPLSAAGRDTLGSMTELIGNRDGGAEAFLSFLIDTLRPELTRRHPETALGPHTLFGHSLGGLFTAFALLTRPDAFDAFVSSSPSLWWDGGAIHRLVPAFRGLLKTLARAPAVLVGVGAREQDVPTEVPARLSMTLDEVQTMVRHARMVDGAAEFVGALREGGLADVRHVVFADEDHGSVVPAALMRAVAVATARCQRAERER
jgi:predicted alpha/beta superfamily hydrolase